MRVPSAVDFPIKLIFSLLAAILTVSVFIVPGEAMMLSLAVIVPVLLLLYWIYTGTYYAFEDGYLLCRSGPFSEKIRYDAIKSARLCQNMMSSMALSSKRIEIRQHGKGYFMGTTMISPVDREAFLQELAGRCPNLEEMA